jgi:hypothetical protein
MVVLVDVVSAKRQSVKRFSTKRRSKAFCYTDLIDGNKPFYLLAILPNNKKIVVKECLLLGNGIISKFLNCFPDWGANIFIYFHSFYH